MQGNILGQSGSSNGLNIFAQPNEPNKKDGIWIKTPEKYKYEKVRFVDDFGLTSSQYKKLTNIPFDFRNSSAVAIGTDIYLLGGGSSPYNYNYKYDTLTGSYTKLTNIPFEFQNSSAVAIGTDIYLLGGGSDHTNYKNNYKYNILTDSYTKLKNIPYNFYSGSAVAIKTNIYLLGGGYYGNEVDAYVYAYVYINIGTTNKTIVIEISGYLFKVLLNKKVEIYFSGAKIYDNDTLQDYPTYYGDGEQWNLLNQGG